MSKFRLALAATLLVSAALSGCAYVPKPAVMSKQAVYPTKTVTQSMLEELPPPERPLAVAVYGFTDQTGQFKPLAATQTLSRAVSQGGSAMLVRSLEGAGNRSWFTIVEREQLKDLLNERQIIREMRSQYLGEKTVNPQALPPLLFAGVILEGGVIGYDTNTVTGGIGASELGIGGDAKYQQDTVTVSLRAVSVKTGEVLTTVTTSKTISSYAVDINVFKYVGISSLLQTENGFTTNEPGLVALQQAIDKAVYGLVMEGVDLKLWNFADPAAGWPSLWRYNQERDGRLNAQQVMDAERRDHRAHAPMPAPTEPPPPTPSAGTARARAPELLGAASGPAACHSQGAEAPLECGASSNSTMAAAAVGETTALVAPATTR
jgi:curli production assembly/transport component CsgG